MKERAWKFILDGFPVWSFAVPVMELLTDIPGPGFSRLFLLLYFTAAFFAAFVLEVTGNRKWIIRLLPILPVVVLIISRDMILLWNCLAAMAVLTVMLLILQASCRKWILPIPLLALLIYYIPAENMPSYVAGCLVAALAAVISGFLKGAERDRWVLLIALTALTACIIPSNEDPIRWEGVRNFLTRVGNFFETTWKDMTYFFEGLSGGEDASYTGYSDTGGLVGGLSGSSKEELYFQMVGRKQPVYLTGAVYAKLGKNGFEDKIETDLPENAWLAMYLSGLAQAEVSRDEAACFSRVERADITYAYIRTSDLLLPATTFRIDNGLKYGLDEVAEKGFNYDIGYLALDISSRYYRRFTERAALTGGTADYETAKKTAAELYNLTLSYYLNEDEYYRCIEVYQEMEQDPDYMDTSMVTDRIRELAYELTKDCGTDTEKILKIEAYLRKYTYDQTVDLRGRDNYVEAFLFEEQRGYCVHYASAMICLLRACGIPARYIQGFLYDPDNGDIVYGSDAHAWVETYIPGMGWMRCEPTAAVQSPDKYGWKLRLRMAEDNEQEPEEEEEESTEELPGLPPVDEKQAEKDEEANSSVMEVLLTVGLYLLGLAGFVGIIIFGYFFIRWILYKRLPPGKKLMYDVQLIRKKLDRKLQPGEKAESVFDYLPLVEDETCRAELEELFRGYYRVRFRGDSANDELVESMRNMVRRIR